MSVCLEYIFASMEGRKDLEYMPLTANSIKNAGFMGPFFFQ